LSTRNKLAQPFAKQPVSLSANKKEEIDMFERLQRNLQEPQHFERLTQQ
jgi:hypothetical protein